MPRVADVVLKSRDAAELPEGCLPRLRRRHPARDVFLDLEIDVGLQLPREIALDGLAPEQRSRAELEHVKPAHISHSEPPGERCHSGRGEE